MIFKGDCYLGSLTNPSPHISNSLAKYRPKGKFFFFFLTISALVA